MLRISLRAYLILFTIFTLLFIGVVSHFSPSSALTADKTAGIVEESMENVHAHRFDKNGHLTQVVTMASWFRYKGKTTTQMQTPLLTIFNQNGTWDISAEQGEGLHGQMNGHIEQIHLSHAVTVKHQGHRPDAWLTLKTQALSFFPKEPMALTDHVVEVSGPGMKIQAQGMRALLNKHEVEFMKNVKSYYDLSQK